MDQPAETDPGALRAADADAVAAAAPAAAERAATARAPADRVRESGAAQNAPEAPPEVKRGRV